MDDLISVIMSTYNEEPDWIRDSIDSILNQTYKNLELIVVLDNPNNTMIKEILFKYQERDERIRLIQNKKNLGLVQSLNIALKYCKGKYIARMDADDISREDRISVEKEYLEKNKLDFVYTGMITIDEKGKQISEWDKEELTYERIKKLMKIRNISIHPTWFLKREIYINLGGYREVPYCEDYDFVLRALNFGYKIGKINENLLMYRVRYNSISRSNNFEQFLISQNILFLYKKNKLGDFSRVSELINSTKEKMNSLEKQKYINAENKFLQGISFMKKGNYFKGIFKMFTGVLGSKYYMLRFFDISKYKLARIFK